MAGIEDGNTSTHVERTVERCSGSGLCGKHLHARGEDSPEVLGILHGVETPPRTWRGRHQETAAAKELRNTSTHVERTCFVVYMLARFEKHLHARGEDSVLVLEAKHVDGNTSTHVERTYNGHKCPVPA